ncbi:phosphoenolpyruvate--protein phosphotransferase [Telmatospirillum siberiense]|uniref:phosphoenolpyruvate--protein phosphotransferase n=1 Tax=Telmatospirillum siberiense TaxID=382514 RepID=A0A2N3PS03_9PROT|nr:phosphoenolpyruvate--protein phosphotransferase [Telmatospirillum siberiense]PKU23187.1 phosphoenolpyruvate--protein phosphotransferase [Telmatospirillum siberiense]
MTPINETKNSARPQTQPAATGESIALHAPLAGWLTALSDVPDPVFSGYVLGHGIAIDPFESVLKAPCDGVVTVAHRARHAVTLRLANGAEVLLHVGLDTVALAGEGFTLHVAEGQAVKTGDPLISFDMDILAHKARSLLVPIIVLGEDYTLSAMAPGRQVAAGEVLFTVSPAGTAPAEAAPQAAGPVLTREFRIDDPDGIHARPAGLIADAVKGFKARIIFHAHDKEADARSPVKLMLLGLGGGDAVRVTAAGGDAEAALAAIGAVIAGFADGKAPSPVPAAGTSIAETPLRPAFASHERIDITGVQAVSGLATGKAVRFAQEEISVPEAGAGVDVELERLRLALEASRQDLDGEIEAARPHNRQQMEILKAHLSFLDDVDLLGAAQTLIDQGKSAGFAWKSAAGQQAAALKRLGSARLAERAVDLLDVERRVLMALAGKSRAGTDLPAGTILLAGDLLPSQLTGMDTSRLAGLCLAEGGPTSHVAILAASLGIPTLVAMGPDLARVPDGTPLILDADHQRLQVNPLPELLSATAAKIEKRQARLALAKSRAAEDCHTACGRRIEVVANLASPADALLAVANGAEGCGLLRSEFLFLNRDTAPSEEEQLAQYQTVADSLEGRPLIIRTLDAGADKVLPYLGLPRETNPALGLRGVRTGIWKPETLRTQLRAILRVQPYGQCRIMVPMVATIDELRTVRTMLDEERRTLGQDKPISLGVMVEVPSAAVMADVFAKECDFFSIGTNDLTQYTLAMDRMNPHLAKRVDAFDPAVLRLIAQAAAAATANGRWTGVCGGLASIPLAAPVLIGLGVTELSTTAATVPEVKEMVRSLSLERCQAVAREALSQESAEAVHRLLSSYWPEV